MAFFASLVQITRSKQKSTGRPFRPLVFDLMLYHFRVQFVTICRSGENIVDHLVKHVELTLLSAAIKAAQIFRGGQILSNLFPWDSYLRGVNWRHAHNVRRVFERAKNR